MSLQEIKSYKMILSIKNNPLKQSKAIRNSKNAHWVIQSWLKAHLNSHVFMRCLKVTKYRTRQVSLGREFQRIGVATKKTLLPLESASQSVSHTSVTGRTGRRAPSAK